MYDYVFPVSSTLHTLAAVVWVGGMFFTHTVLRVALLNEDGPDRLRVWSRVLPRFFSWVWVCIFILPTTGYAMVFFDFGGFEAAGYHVELMHAIGWVMIILFTVLFMRPFRAFMSEVGQENWPSAAESLVAIRRIVTTNLILGLVVIAAGVSGRFWG